MKKTKFALIALTLLLTSCMSSLSDNKEINNKLSQLYSKQQDIYTTKIDTNLFSKDLVIKLNKVISSTKKDQERIKISEFPTDKPIQFEGSVFSSLYEGYSKYSIEKITIKGNKAVALLNFENSLYKDSWSDEVVLVKENGWKIDNVLFSKKNSLIKNLKEKLKTINKSL